MSIHLSVWWFSHRPIIIITLNFIILSNQLCIGSSICKEKVCIRVVSLSLLVSKFLKSEEKSSQTLCFSRYLRREILTYHLSITAFWWENQNVQLIHHRILYGSENWKHKPRHSFSYRHVNIILLEEINTIPCPHKGDKTLAEHNQH